jgi:hypothetical protein
VNTVFIEFEVEIFGDLGLAGRNICIGILQNLKAKFVETWA